MPIVLATLVSASIAFGQGAKERANARTVEILAQELSSTNWETQTKAVYRLIGVVTNWQGTNLDAFLPDVEPLIAKIGYGGIGRTESTLAANLLARLSPVSTAKLIEATKSSETRLRFASAQILGAIRPVQTNGLIALYSLAADSDSYVRRVCYESIMNLGDQATDGIALLRRATNDPSPYNRVIIFNALGHRAGESSSCIPIISSYLTNEDSHVRCLAATMLGGFGPSASNTYPQLTLALKSGDPQLRVYAAASLGRIGVKSPELVESLVSALENDTELEVRRSAAASLGNLGRSATNAVPALIRTLRQAEAESGGRTTGWYLAARALGCIGGQEAEIALRAALTSKDRDIRSTAEKSLLQMGSRSQSPSESK